MTDGPRKSQLSTESADPVSRRDFLEHGTRYGLGIGAASLLASGLWLPAADASSGDDTLGDADPALQASGTQQAQTLTLSNAAILAQWSVYAGRMRVVRVREPNGAVLDVSPDAFVLLLDGEPVRSSEMRLVGAPSVGAITTRGSSARLADRLPGRQVVAQFEDYAKRLRVDWRAELRDGSRYVRQEITVRPAAKDIPAWNVEASNPAGAPVFAASSPANRATPRRARRVRNNSRALWSRVLTVPTGHCRWAAASSLVLPSR